MDNTFENEENYYVPEVLAHDVENPRANFQYTNIEDYEFTFENEGVPETEVQMNVDIEDPGNEADDEDAGHYEHLSDQDSRAMQQSTKPRGRPRTRPFNPTRAVAAARNTSAATSIPTPSVTPQAATRVRGRGRGRPQTSRGRGILNPATRSTPTTSTQPQQSAARSTPFIPPAFVHASSAPSRSNPPATKARDARRPWNKRTTEAQAFQNANRRAKEKRSQTPWKP